MHGSESAIEAILSKDDDVEFHESEGRPGRKPGVKPAVKPVVRDRQAWRAIEDLRDSRRLDRKLKEIYEED